MPEEISSISEAVNNPELNRQRSSQIHELARPLYEAAKSDPTGDGVRPLRNVVCDVASFVVEKVFADDNEEQEKLLSVLASVKAGGNDDLANLESARRKAADSFQKYYQHLQKARCSKKFSGDDPKMEAKLYGVKLVEQVVSGSLYTNEDFLNKDGIYSDTKPKDIQRQSYINEGLASFHLVLSPDASNVLSQSDGSKPYHEHSDDVINVITSAKGVSGNE